ncbi:MAG: translocation/assembly module TamB domain-containing protein [Caulobacter sp.]|nr:translocation/assembly module TamB domain-containing protein [Caulobacter sp.]
MTAADDAQAAPTARRRRVRLPATGPGWIILASLLAVLLVGGTALVLRFGLNTAPGLMFVEARANGLKLGRFGNLRIEGLSGDLWRNFGVRRLTITDEKGVWLDAADVQMTWRYHELFVRRFHADTITAGQVRVLRRPTLTPKRTSKGLPVSIRIEQLRIPVETLPAFSYERGLFHVAGKIEVVRKGPTTVALGAASRLHQGDRLILAVETGKGRPLKVFADALEAQGGALAGALGLPADQPFMLKVNADGTGEVGRFSLLATSGATRPAEASGTWNVQGGVATGRLSLAASTLTTRYAAMFGDEVRFSGRGGKAKSGLYAINARAESEVLAVSASGEADIGKRVTGKDGIAVALTSRSLGRLTSGAVQGAAESRGRLTGNQASWLYTGALSATGFKAAGYNLARAQGPVTIGMKAGELTVESTLTGDGGAGQGYVAALLGARPRAEIVAARLKDGRLLLRRVQATGAGLKLNAAGERTLLGGLSFKGDAEMANLQAARIGANGRATATWSASQGGRGKPWVFSVDAKGAGFATGLGELDRLLGAAPRLRGKAEYSRGVVSVANLELDGALGSARTAGTIGPAGALKLKLDWDATGPFRAGPVEISGEAKGTGAITGALSAPRADLIADIAAVDLPRLPLRAAHVVLSFARSAGGTDGAVTITADSEYGPARARTDFRFAQGGLDLTGVDADAGGIKATGGLALRRGRPSTANLILDVGPGAILTSGQISGTAVLSDSGPDGRATLNLTAREASVRGAGGLRFARGTITADGSLSRLPIVVDMRGTYGANRWRFRGDGVYAAQDKATGLALNGEGRFGAADFKTVETARIGFGGGQRFADVKLEIEGGRAEIIARMDGEVANVDANLTRVSLGALNEDLAGTVGGKLTLQGQGARLTGSMDVTLEGARARGAGRAVSVDGRVRATLNDQSLFIEAVASNASGLRSSATLTLPVEASAAPLRLAIANRQPMNGVFAANGEIRPLWDLLVGGERSLSGVVDMKGTIAGSLADPRLSGTAELANGGFVDGQTGLTLVNLSVRAVLADNAIDVSRFSATDGRGGRISGGERGTLSGGGRISLLRDGVSTFRVGLNDFQLIENDAITAIASGEATLNRAADGRVQLSGALTIDRAVIAADPPTPSGVIPMAVIERNKPGATEGDVLPEARRGLVVGLDVTLKADRGIFIEGRGLDAEMSIDARVSGTTARPVLDGVARIVRGEYDFAGKRFEFDTRSAVYLAASPDRIRLDLTATREDPALTAVIRVRGTASRPEITLTSSPSLPQDEVLSRVLFGTSAAQLSPLEAAQLASAIAALAGGGGFDVIGNLKDFTGLDRLVFAGGGEGGAMTVAGGKYLTDDVYLEIIGGGRDGPAAQVEWRVRRNLSIISRLAGEDSRLSVRWRKDY